MVSGERAWRSTSPSPARCTRSAQARQAAAAASVVNLVRETTERRSGMAMTGQEDGQSVLWSAVLKQDKVQTSQGAPMAHAYRMLATSVLVSTICPAVVPAQPGARANAPSGTQILLLGTAAGPPLRVTRSEPATLLIVDGRAYLIDCGIGTMQRLQAARVPSEQIRTIFFTHLHADHTLGLADVLGNDVQQMDLRPPGPAVDIYRLHDCTQRYGQLGSGT